MVPFRRVRNLPTVFGPFTAYAGCLPNRDESGRCIVRSKNPDGRFFRSTSHGLRPERGERGADAAVAPSVPTRSRKAPNRPQVISACERSSSWSQALDCFFEFTQVRTRSETRELPVPNLTVWIVYNPLKQFSSIKIDMIDLIPSAFW